MNSPPKLVSCQRCRIRKVKCNNEFPCVGCVKAGVECVQLKDLRKKRPAASYVTKLESKVRALTSFVESLHRADSLDSTKAILARVDLKQLIGKTISDDAPDESVAAEPPHDVPLGSAAARKNSIYDDQTEGRAIYGPTSVYDDSLISKNLKNSKSAAVSAIRALNTDPDILHCLKLFFTWQYPDHNMFIFREAFLIDFFDPKPNSTYCSKVLILSICALGSKMSDDDAIYNKSVSFYDEAKSLLLGKLNNPSITSLQSFLLLAFYDITNGYNSSGWMLSGNAMRMGFDLGFQLNPEVWFVKSKEHLSPLDVSIRSRIYWGSYVADHFISLLLGRPSLLKLTDASIPETNDLPDLEWIDEFTYRGSVEKQKLKASTAEKASLSSQSAESEPSYISNPLNQIINLINISDNMLNDIFTKSEIENDQSNHEDLNLVSRLEKLNEYNAQIRKWKESLPPDLQWDRKSLRKTAENPTLTCIRYYYYILVLCLNRPFVGIVRKRESKSQPQSLSPLKICDEAIDDLFDAIHKFQSTHGFRRVSIFIVYCSILSISIILLTNTSKQLIDEKRDRLQFFMDVLKGSSKTWKLAEKSYIMISIKLKTRYENPDEHDEEVNLSPKTQTTRPHNVHDRILESPIKVKSEPDEIDQILENPNAIPIERQNHQLLTRPDHHIPELLDNKSVVDTNTELLFDKSLDFLGGPPVLMTSDLFNEDWESLFPDYMFNPNN